MSAVLGTPKTAGVAVRTLSPEELRSAHEVFSSGDQLARFASEHGFENELDALKSIGESLGMPVIDMSGFEMDADILHLCQQFTK